LRSTALYAYRINLHQEQILYYCYDVETIKITVKKSGKQKALIKEGQTIQWLNGKKKTKSKLMLHKILHSRLKIEQHERTKYGRKNSDVPEGSAATIPQ